MILSCGCLKVSLQKVYYLFLLHPTQHMGTELPGPGVEPRSLQGKHGVLITGPHGSSEIVQKYQNMAFKYLLIKIKHRYLLCIILSQLEA